MANDTDQQGVRQTAEQLRGMVEEQTGTSLVYDLPSLAFFDRFLSEWLDLASVYGDQNPRTLDLMIVPIASYVGEVFVRSLGAKWDDDLTPSARMPLLSLPTGQHVDLDDAVSKVVHGLARPAFHDLAIVLSHLEDADH